MRSATASASTPDSKVKANDAVDGYQPSAVSMPVPWILPADSSAVRLPARPLRFQQEGFDAAFDATTLFYDCFMMPNGREAVLLGPPLLNLGAAMTDVRAYAQPSGAACGVRLRSLDRHSQLWIDVPHGTTAIGIRSLVGSRVVAPRPNDSFAFAGRRVLLTLSRDNQIEWILDWVRFHRDVHGADAVLLYDNGSKLYGPDDLARAVNALHGIAAVRVMDWPFRYGPQSFHGKHWDSDFCQSGVFEDARWRFLQNARSVLNCDIDELVVSSTGESVFERTEKSRRGYIRFHGQWIVALDGNAVHSNASTDAGLGRHRDYKVALTVKREWQRWRLVQKNRCAPKWAAVPTRIPADSQWKTHTITGMQPWPTSDPGISYRHLRGINTSWKYQRTTSEKFDAQKHANDEELIGNYARVQWES